VAFALRLTWQSPRSATEEAVVGQSPSDATLPKGPDPDNRTSIPNPTDTASGLSEGAAKIDLVDAESPKLASQDPAQVAQRPVRGTGQPASSSFSWAPPVSVPSAGAASLILDKTEFQPRELSAVISPQNSWAGSRPLNGAAVTGRTTDSSTAASSRSSLTTASSKTLPKSSMIPAEIDTQPQRLVKAPEPVEAKTAPETRLSAGGHGFTVAETPVRTKAPTSQIPAQQEDRLTESDMSPHRPPATSATTPLIRQGTPENDSHNPMSPDAENSESDGKASRVPLPQKSSETQDSHERASIAPEGVPLVPEPSKAPQTRTEVTEPSQAPAVSPETEVPSAAQSQPIHEISLRLAGTASSHVDVQVAERSGKVQVAVRTADQDLAKSLQGNLGELTARLEEKGFRTEAWTPIAASHGGWAVRQPATSADSQSHPDSSGSQGGQPHSQQGQQHSKQRQQGLWKAQFEETLSMPNATTEASW